MAKIKNVSQLNLPGKSDSDFCLNDSSAANEDAFSSILSSASRTDESDDKSKSENESSSSFENGGASDKIKKEAKAGDSKEVKTENSSEVSNDKSRKVDEVEDAEIKEMEAYEISLAQLAQQLNVAMTLVQQQNQQPGKTNMPEIRLGGGEKIASVEDFKKIISGVAPQLLRRVDVQSLEKQLKKIFKNADAEMPEVPDAPIQLPLNEQVSLQGGAGLELSAPEMQQIIQSAVQQGASPNLNLAATLPQAADVGGNEFVLEAPELEPIKLVTGVDVTQKTFKEQDFVFLKMTHDGPAAQVEENSKVEGASYFSQLASERLAKKNSDQAGLIENSIIKQLDLSHIPAPREYVMQPPALTLAQKLNARVEKEIQFEVSNTIVDMSRMDRSGKTRIQIRPPELGQIDIEIKVKDKKVTARISTDQTDTHELMMRLMPEIRDILRSEGFQLDGFTARHDPAAFQSSSFAHSQMAGNGHQGAQSESDDHYVSQDLVSEIAQNKNTQATNSNKAINVTV